MATTIRQWQALYGNDAFSDPSEEIQIQAGWVDWTCKASALAGKTRTMAGFITRMQDGGKVVLDEASVSFKNTQPEDSSPYDMAVLFNRAGTQFVVTLDDARCDDGRKWHVYDYEETDGSSPAEGFDTVVQLAKWLNEPRAESHRSAKFVPTAMANPDLIAEAVADAREKFGVEPEFTGIWKKYFRDAEQAGVWLGNNLRKAEPGLLLVAMFGGSGIAGYVID